MRDQALNPINRQCRLEKPTCLTTELAGSAMALFTAAYDWRLPVRSLTVGTADLVDGEFPEQLSLFADEARRRRLEQAERAVDGIRSRFGYHAIGRALFLTDRSIGRLNPQQENTVHPVGFFNAG